MRLTVILISASLLGLTGCSKPVTNNMVEEVFKTEFSKKIDKSVIDKIEVIGCKMVHEEIEKKGKDVFLYYKSTCSATNGTKTQHVDISTKWQNSHEGWKNIAVHY